MDIPHITADQLAVLDQLFPDKLPPKGTDANALAYLQGQRSVVELLHEHFNRYQAENSVLR